jgi:uncharacterized damage-inducible protein DinB
MTDREFFQVRRKAERDVFLRFMRALPGDKLSYRPHERSQSAGELLTTLVHHRGQLSSYIRPMGGQVPPIYGPSGDSRR